MLQQSSLIPLFFLSNSTWSMFNLVVALNVYLTVICHYWNKNVDQTHWIGVIIIFFCIYQVTFRLSL